MAEQGGGQASNQAQNQSQNEGRASGSRGGSRGGRRRGRGGRNRGQGNQSTTPGSRGGRNAASQATAADGTDGTPSTTPQVEQPASSAPESSASSRGRRNRRGQRGGSHGSENRGRGGFRVGPHRQFGGRLTTTTEEPAQATSQDQSLSADAPEFVPGQPVAPRSAPESSSAQSQPPTQPRSKGGRSRSDRKQGRPKQDVPKSTAPDLWQRIQEDISNWNYECRICADDVTRKSYVWSCTVCWTVVHLKCAHQWWSTSMKVDEATGDKSWRCPGCNSSLTGEPGDYQCVCGTCEVAVKARCYCGRVEKEMECFKQDEACDSYDPTNDSWFQGSFSCENACGRAYDCGIHRCETSCHPQDELPAHCPFSPDVVTHCPCGKTPLKDLMDHPRQSCEEHVPHCERVCEKKLKCGHTCQSLCHTGDCDPCMQVMDIDCRCGRVTAPSICHEGDIQHPLCFKVCQATRNCGRHRCGEHCCPGEKKAAQRIAQQKKQRSGVDSIQVEAEHICVQVCGRPLKCGSHFSATAVQRFFNLLNPVALASHIAHPSVGARPLAVIPLLSISVILMTLNALLAPISLRSLHTCRKLCHRPGECGDAREGCEQVCGKTKLLCNHTCQNVCHGQTPCNESTACQKKMVVQCPCGNYKKEFKCLASTSNPTPSRPELRCDEECERLDRNRRLAAALNIDPASHTNDHVPFSDNTLKLYKQFPSWGDSQERHFRVFAANPDEVRLRYEPMRNESRQFLHLLAEDFGLESKSEDYGSNRSVVVWKTDKFVSAPPKTLAQCVKIRAAQAAEAAAAAALRPPSPPPFDSEPFNSMVLTEPRFGLTIDEVTTALASDLASLQGFSFKTDFLNDEVLIKATAQYSAFLTPAPVEKSLAALKPRIEQTIRSQKLAEGVLLCHSDDKGAVTRREVLRRPGAGGWSAVAGRAASKPTSSSSTPAPEDSIKPGRKLLGLKKKKPQQPEAGKVWAALDGDVEC
ncbi:R3H domain-containing protein [Fusarium falciforme]|uniref:R3H domain-containing protein n=1 Tax=Fusarium falciforme TaxID=195108 RepID=UPI0023009138|nr:R3H domain-containing protein [Fusarium falciforme]WAO88177.1 R3H domain-containing protein [Fusarium falciforme]